jgi:glycine/D-amino acid oxidase-like deaminating enzyme
VRYSERVPLSRRRFLQSAALVGLSRKSGRRIEGGFALESHELGHRIRDGCVEVRTRQQRRAPLVIVGGGIAGLSAGWRLLRRGFGDFVVLEMEREAGGNSRSGANGFTAYPWAAHYVPVPGPEATLARELFDDLGVRVDGRWDERHLCHAPQERLFLHGRWQAGFEPQVGPTRRDRDQVARFEDLMAGHKASGGFKVPMGEVAGSPLDALSMRAWLDREGLDSKWLAWLVDYGCRDDYGALSADTSAWAGIHYFASRASEQVGPLTWPEGNAFITHRLLQRLGDRVVTGQVVSRIARHGARWLVTTPDTLWTADAVIFAAPSFLASRLVEGAPAAPDFVYSPWITANLTLDRWPAERGVPIAWDNVIVDSPSLGYVVATHQSLRTHIPETVWTYYWALAHGDPRQQRQWLLDQDWATLSTRILDDLSRAHPDIRDCVTRVDICRLGHAMIRPTPGFLSSPSRQALRRGLPHLFFANSDVSGLSLFEEAQARGVDAADRAIQEVWSLKC